jgi:hypothetical protein
LKPIWATRQNQPETLLTKENLLNKKAKLENLLAENQTQTWLEKTPPLKKWVWISEQITKPNLRNKDGFGFALGLPNGLRYLRVGGRGFCLGAGKTRSEENAWKCRRIPHVRCTLC